MADNKESSCKDPTSGAESSSSVSTFTFLFVPAAFGLGFRVVCIVFLVAALGAAAFLVVALGAAFALGALAFCALD